MLWYDVSIQLRIPFRRAIAVSILLFGSGLLVMWWQQERLVYLPGSASLHVCATALPHEVVVTPEGIEMLVFGRSTRVAVLYHGNAGTACDRTPYVAPLLSRGYQVFLVEYPGFAGGLGRPTHRRTLAAVDSVRAYLRATEPTTLLVLGESLGSGPALLHAVSEAADHVVLITPFTRLSDIVRAGTLGFLLAPLTHDAFQNMDQVSDYTGSVLIFAAEQDEMIPLAQADTLYQAARRAKSRRIVIAPGAEHNTVFLQPGMWQELTDWLR